MHGDDSDSGIDVGDASRRASLTLEDMFRFCMFGHDSDDDDCEGEDGLEDMYDFDLEKVAEAIRNGADDAALASALDASLCEALEQCLASGPSTAPVSDGRRSEGADDSPGPGVHVVNGSLSGLMTPEEAASVPADSTPPAIAALRNRLQTAEALGAAGRSWRRRSSMSAHHRRLAEAVKEETVHRRRSLQHLARTAVAAAAEVTRRQSVSGDGPSAARIPASPAAVKRLVAKECHRQRRSLLKAAEALCTAGELADVPEGSARRPSKPPTDDEEEVALSRQLRRISDAMTAACRRHRQSVAEAVRQVIVEEADASPGSSPRTPGAAVGAAVASAASERIELIVRRAYLWHRERRTSAMGGARGSMDGNDAKGQLLESFIPTPARSRFARLLKTKTVALEHSPENGGRSARLVRRRKTRG